MGLRLHAVFMVDLQTVLVPGDRVLWGSDCTMLLGNLAKQREVETEARVVKPGYEEEEITLVRVSACPCVCSLSLPTRKNVAGSLSPLLPGWKEPLEWQALAHF